MNSNGSMYFTHRRSFWRVSAKVSIISANLAAAFSS